MMEEWDPRDEFADPTVRMFREGTPEALKVFFMQYYPEVYMFSMMLLDNNALVTQKIVMDVFWLLWERHADFETDEDIKSFLYMAARNKCWQYVQYQPQPSVNLADMRTTASRYGIPEDILQELFAFAAAAPAL